MLTPYFDSTLPAYLHYASVGVAIGKEILRSITRAFDAKVMRCVPSSVNVYSNASQLRMDLLLQSGGTQIAYHSLLSLSGPIKGTNSFWLKVMRIVSLHPNRFRFQACYDCPTSICCQHKFSFWSLHRKCVPMQSMRASILSPKISKICKCYDYIIITARCDD